MTESIVSLKNLRVDIPKKKSTPVPILRGIDLEIPKGKIIGIVGESGSGKSMTMKSIMDILPETAVMTKETFEFNGKAVTNPRELPIAMIFQDPMTSLNPLRTVGFHLREVIRRQKKMSKKEANQLAIKELAKVGIPLPEKRMKQFPHELSGGMRQRVMIAMALLAQPELLIADEPTTALDVTIQAQILSLIKDLQESEGLSVVLVTHDFGVVAGMCDFVKVMYQGLVLEEGTIEDIFYAPQHPYTKQLLEAAHLGDKDAELKLFDYHEELPDTLIRKDISATHRVWLTEESTN